MRRIKYAIGTVDPRDEGVAVPETGLGSLIPRLAEQAYGTTNNTTLGNRMYGGLYAEDPTEEELASGFLDISQAEGTPTYGIPDFDRYSYASRDFRSIPSLYELYLTGGLDDYAAGVDPSTETVDTPVGTEGGGDTAQIPGAMDSLVTPDTEVNPFADIDTGVGEFDDLGPVDTTMPPMLSPDMGASMVTSPNDTTVLGGDPVINNMGGYLNNVTDEELYGITQTSGSIPPGEKGGPGYVEPPTPDNVIAEANIPDYFDMNLLDETANIGAVDQAPPGIMNPYQPTLEELANESNLNLTGGLPTYDRVLTANQLEESPAAPIIDTAMAPPSILAQEEPLDIEDFALREPTIQEQEIKTLPDIMEPGVANVEGALIPGDAPIDTIMDPNLMNIRQQQAQEGLTLEQSNTLKNIVGQAGQTVEGALNQLSQIPGTVIDYANQTADIFGKKFNVGKTIASVIANKIAGGPISLVFDALSAVLPKYEPTFTETTLKEELGVTEDGKFAGDPTTSAFAGLNAVSMFGDPVETAKDRINTRLDTIENNPNISKDFKEDTQEMIDEYDRVTNELGDIDPTTTTGDAKAAEAAPDLNIQEALDRASDVQRGDASVAEEIAAADRAAAQRAANARAMAEAAARAVDRHRGNGGNSGNQGADTGSGGESGFGGFCFDPNTFVQMADGSEKKIKEIKLGENTKGGEVTGVFQFKATDEIHDYKGVTVAGSHYVKEDGKFIMVQDSPLSVKIDKIPVVYSLDTTGRRIFIKGIEFADYNGDGIAKGFLHNAGVPLKDFNKEVLRQVQQRLI